MTRKVQDEFDNITSSVNPLLVGVEDRYDIVEWGIFLCLAVIYYKGRLESTLQEVLFPQPDIYLTLSIQR